MVGPQTYSHCTRQNPVPVTMIMYSYKKRKYMFIQLSPHDPVVYPKLGVFFS